jgi:hypothetical protein
MEDSFKKLNIADVKEQYQARISNSIVALES